MTRILVIEDDPNVADFVRRGLVQSGFEIDVAPTGHEGLDRAELARPEIAILDLMLPDIDGIDVCRQLRAAGDIGIIILTARGVVGERVRGLEAGADDYLLKPFAFEELLARIRAVLRRRSPGKGVLRVADIEVDVERREVRRGNRRIDLTNREFELLKLLAQQAGKPLSRERIIACVWGPDFEGETDPVKVYMTFLRRKLNASGEPDLIYSIRGFGYALRESPCD